jgi:hypothetical protein
LPENDKNMEFQIPYITGHERAKASGPVDLDKRPVAAHEDVGHLTASLEASEALIKRMEAQLRFQHEVLAEIHALTEPDSQHPLTDRDLIRVKAQVALRQAAKSGLLS